MTSSEVPHPDWEMVLPNVIKIKRNSEICDEMI